MMSKDDRELIEALRNWPAAQHGDALSAGFVSALLASAATRLEALQAQPVGEAERSPAQFFFEVGYVACWAEAFVRNNEKAPFALTDAIVERGWEIAGEAHDDPQEFDRYLALANAAALTASPPVVEREAETFNGYSRATAERALARVHAWCAWSENEYAGEDTNPRMCSDDVRTALALVSTPVAQGDEVRDALEPCKTEYGWLIELDGPQGLSYCIGSKFDPDHAKALRFARREDAQAFCEQLSVAHTRIAEHAWD